MVLTTVGDFGERRTQCVRDKLAEGHAQVVECNHPSAVRCRGKLADV